MAFTITDTQLFEILKQRMSEEEARSIVDFVVAKLKEQNLKVSR